MSSLNFHYLQFTFIMYKYDEDWNIGLEQLGGEVSTTSSKIWNVG